MRARFSAMAGYGVIILSWVACLYMLWLWCGIVFLMD